jgi:hypothetical protein
VKIATAAICCTCDEVIPVGVLVCPSCTDTAIVPLSLFFEPLQERAECAMVKL